ncbi:MAG: hypothetical protein JRH01_20785 [Deltaproteobacteria bacterium]|nr:hypothetical protein [Deltaproteobacteria bacterium]MBW2394837.1 hypothetical protein [Deltaproteobacteria bacterium]
MTFPELEQLVPQAGSMCLLDRVLRHDERETACAVRPAASGALALPDGRIPATAALEWMAQCIAAHAGLRAHEEGRPLWPGLFLGARRATLPPAAFDTEGELVVTARWVRGRAQGTALGAHAFDCEVRTFEAEAGERPPLAHGTLNVMVVEDLAELASRGAGAWR